MSMERAPQQPSLLLQRPAGAPAGFCQTTSTGSPRPPETGILSYFSRGGARDVGALTAEGAAVCADAAGRNCKPDPGAKENVKPSAKVSCRRRRMREHLSGLRWWLEGLRSASKGPFVRSPVGGCIRSREGPARLRGGRSSSLSTRRATARVRSCIHASNIPIIREASPTLPSFEADVSEYIARMPLSRRALEMTARRLNVLAVLMMQSFVRWATTGNFRRTQHPRQEFLCLAPVLSVLVMVPSPVTADRKKASCALSGARNLIAAPRQRGTAKKSLELSPI